MSMRLCSKRNLENQFLENYFTAITRDALRIEILYCIPEGIRDGVLAVEFQCKPPDAISQIQIPWPRGQKLTLACSMK